MPRGEIPGQKTDAYISGVWYTIARNQMKYNSTVKQITFENLAGQITTTAWDCCHKVSETQPDGSTITWDYNDDGRVIASSRLIPLDRTNVTWVTTCYVYDDLGRQTATWTTNFAARLGTPETTTRYDGLGRVISHSVPGYGTSQTSYSPSALIVTNTAPNGATMITRRNADGDTVSITGTGVTPEFFSRGVLADGTCWTKTVQGETATNSSDTFTYDNYLCVARHRDGVDGASATDRFVWDPTEPVATRPLVFCQPTTPLQFYTHDGNKNVSEIVFFQQDDGIAAHYEYAPFGAVTATGHSIPASAYDFCEYNSFRFSSEYYDILISLHSYNFRCYDSLNGRWCTRDMLHEQGFRKSHEICKSSLSVEDSFYEDFQFVKNAPLSYSDYLGLKYSLTNPFKVGQVKFENCSECQLKSFRLIPEHYSKGEELKVPNAGWNSSVDGVWVEGIQKWLKIPNHCYATIICSKGCDFEYRWKCNAFLSLIQKIRGKIYEVDFVPDQGETNHPTNYPF